MSGRDKFKAMKSRGVCYKCLCIGNHISKICSSNKCDVLTNGVPCAKDHHAIIHDVFTEPSQPNFTTPMSHNMTIPMSHSVSRDGHLLMLGEAQSNGRRISMIYDGF